MDEIDKAIAKITAEIERDLAYEEPAWADAMRKAIEMGMLVDTGKRTLDSLGQLRIVYRREPMKGELN
jgi:hypothetical protein